MFEAIFDCHMLTEVCRKPCLLKYEGAGHNMESFDGLNRVSCFARKHKFACHYNFTTVYL